MKIAKILGILLLVYIAIVAIFESLLGYYQPSGGGTLVITTTDSSGATNDRVLSKLESDGVLFVAANHWPRGWYNDALERPEVSVQLDGETKSYRAVPATDAEHAKVQSENPHGIVFKLLTGFPPRYFLKLEPDS